MASVTRFRWCTAKIKIKKVLTTRKEDIFLSYNYATQNNIVLPADDVALVFKQLQMFK